MAKKQTKEQKRAKQAQKRTLKNKAFEAEIKTAFKKAVVQVKNKTADALKIISDTFKKFDQAQAKGIIHKNLASRKKSRLALLYNKVFKK